MLPPQHRLHRSEEFRSVTRGGKRVGGRYVVLHVLPESTRTTRVGFVVSKAIGNAVERNRVKRRLRHGVAELIHQIAPPADIVVRALPASATATFTDLKKEMIRGFRKIGALQ